MIYDMNKTFHENISKGLRVDVPVSIRAIPPEAEWAKVLDYKVTSRIGLFACPLSATAEGVALASKLGFDVITWKTIRSKASEPHPVPNLTYVRFSENGIMATKEKTTSLANSIGNPSYELESTLQEMQKGLTALQKGQILIASIYGVGQTKKEIIDDFAYLAQRVAAIGVHAIELNCSCPNVTTGLYCKDIDFMRDIVEAVLNIVSIPVVVKVSQADSYEQLQELLITCAKAGVRGVAGINTIGMQVVDQNGLPFFGPSRLFAGISGDAIFHEALKWVRDARMIIKTNNLDLTIFGGGGITAAEKFDQFFAAGADVGMVATGALIDPTVAMNYHEKKYLIPDRSKMIQTQTQG
jgi:dihydroorotate dehydrogenase